MFGAAPLARETVIGSFVEGARVRADALTALADAVGGEAAGRDRSASCSWPIPRRSPPMGPMCWTRLRATYAAHERAAMLIAARLDAE